MILSRWFPALLVSLTLRLLGAEPAACPNEETLAALLEQQHWEEIVRCFPPRPDATADADYSYGIALARLQRWTEATKAFEAGATKEPGEKRFALELAGVAFKQEQHAVAKQHVQRALRLDPHDGYANDFLATLYLLEGNLEAALKYWNRTQKPWIEQLKAEPEPRLDAVLLDRAFAFSPGSMLAAKDLAATRKRVDLLDVFPAYRFELLARDDERFDVSFHAIERNGWGRGPLGTALGLLRGLPYETIYPEYFNIRGTATNFRSLLRWDSNKRRAFLAVSGPLGGEARRRYEFFFDGRDENWQVPSAGGPVTFEDFGFKKQEAGFNLTSVVNGAFTWRTGVALAHRSFQDAALDATPPALFSPGWLGRSRVGVDYQLFHRPEQRLTLDSSTNWELGKVWEQGGSVFAQANAGLTLQWFPRSRNDDYATTLGWRAGTTFGEAPVDALYALGVERDNDLWLRGHIGTRDGKKGNAPLGDRYTLVNAEVDKHLYRNPLLTISLGPFLDSGWISGSGGTYGSNGWLWDAGLQCKIRTIDGLVVRLIYGRSLHSGRGGFYGTSSR